MAIEDGTVAKRPAAAATDAAGTMETRGRELGRHADEAGERIGAGLRETARGLGETKQHVRERVGDATDAVKSGIQRGHARVSRGVQENPMQALLWAAGIGALAGVLLARRTGKSARRVRGA